MEDYITKNKEFLNNLEKFYSNSKPIIDDITEDINKLIERLKESSNG